MGKRAAYSIHYVLIAALICKVLSEVWYSVTYVYPYEGFEISDWLINYEGGFVRRGLLGQLLLWAYQCVPFDMKTFIVAFDIIWLALFVGMMVYVCRKQRWSMLPVFFALAFISGGVPRHRRDYLMLLIIYGIYALYVLYNKRKRALFMVAVQALTSVLILIYEPAFFLTVPLLGLLYYSALEGHWFRRMVRTGLVFSVPTAVMALVCLWKGSPGQADVIWASWSNLFTRYPQAGSFPPIGEGVDFLGYDMWAVFYEHLDILYCVSRWPAWDAILAALLMVSCFPLVYAFTTRLPQVDHTQRTLSNNMQQGDLSSVFLIQLVAMTPMLTVLSCDPERTIPYIVFTTLMYVQLAHTHGVPVTQPQWLARDSQAIQAWLDRFQGINRFWGYTMLFIVFLLILFVWMILSHGGLLLSPNTTIPV